MGMGMPHLLMLITVLLCYVGNAAETCSRTATINYRTVLVDTNSNAKGEGLRYYLEKDPVAKSYLNKYQDESNYTWKVATLGTVGSGLVIAGLLKSSDSDSSGITSRPSLILSGVALIALNFFVSKTFEHGNEKNLQKAVDEYNKRNLPKIYFSPYRDQSSKGSAVPGVLGGMSMEF